MDTALFTFPVVAFAEVYLMYGVRKAVLKSTLWAINENDLDSLFS